MNKRLLICTAMLIAAVLSLVACSERAVDGRSGKGLQLAIRFSSSQAALEDWQFRLRITGEGLTPIVLPLTLVDGFLTGEADVSPGLRTFTIEVYETLDGGESIIYSGSSTIEVIADAENIQLLENPISLTPVSPLLRTSPAYVQDSPGSNFSVDVNLHKVPGASQISFRLYYDPAVVTPTSAVLHSAFPNSDYTIFVAQNNDYLALSIFDTVTANVSFTDANGDAPLATVFFSIQSRTDAITSQISLDSSHILDAQGLEIMWCRFILMRQPSTSCRYRVLFDSANQRWKA